MDRFQEMQVFVAVVEAGNFVHATDTVGLSKAAVSRYVAHLEARLGVRLLHRTTRTLSLTEEGEVFYTRCKDLLAELEEYEAEITSRSGRAVGQVRVNAPLTFGNLHLAPLWGEFRAEHPDVSLDVTLSDRVVDLVEEGYDLAVRIARLPSSNLISRKLSATRMVLCASPGYVERFGAPSHPEELADHRVWAYSYFAGGDEWPFEGPDGPVAARIRPVMRTNSGDTCRVGALQGRRIVLQPSFIVGPDLERGDLIELMPAYRSVELGIYALYPSRKHLSPKVRLLIDFLVAAFREPGWPE
ncbi:LysR family transcriptional regulator [Ectothiorhodospiraceae bacterium WFHF3C12]|nr:LysR family transcriptional regulator [Ectothiorhodospiraceae bacterium WFHF3C12]